jgi:hypothetical protein
VELVFIIVEDEDGPAAATAAAVVEDVVAAMAAEVVACEALELEEEGSEGPELLLLFLLVVGVIFEMSEVFGLFGKLEGRAGETALFIGETANPGIISNCDSCVSSLVSAKKLEDGDMNTSSEFVAFTIDLRRANSIMFNSSRCESCGE